MITQIDDYFALGCGCCARFATADCWVRHWQAGVLAMLDTFQTALADDPLPADA